MQRASTGDDEAGENVPEVKRRGGAAYGRGAAELQLTG